MKSRYGPIWALGFGQLAVLLLWTTYDFFVPIFLQAGRPDFDAGSGLRGFGLNSAITGLVMTLDNMAGLLILPYIGALSDRTRTRWGRRKPYLMLGVPLAAVAFSLIPLMLGRPLALFMGAIIMTLLAMDLVRTPLTALLPDLTPPDQRSPANGLITLLQGLGAILAFVAGGALFGRSPVAPFLLGSGVLLAATLLVLARVREPARPEVAEEGTPGVMESLGTVLRDRDRSALSLLGALFFAWLAVSGNRVFFSRYAISSLHLSPEVAGQMMGLFAMGLLVGSVPAGLLGARWGRRRVMRGGLLLCASSLATNTVIDSVPPLAVAQVVSGMSLALVLVNALPLLLDHAPPGRDGVYSGLFYLATQLSEILGPILSGSLLHQVGNARALFVFSPLMLLLACACLRSVRRGEVAERARREPLPVTR